MFWTLSTENWPKLTENYQLGKEGARYNEMSSRSTNTLYLVLWDIRYVLGNKLHVLNSLQWELTENYQFGKEGARYNEMSSRPTIALYLLVWDIWQVLGNNSLFWTLSNENWPKLTENCQLGKEGARYNEMSSRPTIALYLVIWDITYVLGNKLHVLDSLQWELTKIDRKLPIDKIRC